MKLKFICLTILVLFFVSCKKDNVVKTTNSHKYKHVWLSYNDSSDQIEKFVNLLKNSYPQQKYYQSQNSCLLDSCDVSIYGESLYIYSDLSLLWVIHFDLDSKDTYIQNGHIHIDGGVYSYYPEEKKLYPVDITISDGEIDLLFPTQNYNINIGQYVNGKQDAFDVTGIWKLMKKSKKERL